MTIIIMIITASVIKSDLNRPSILVHPHPHLHRGILLGHRYREEVSYHVDVLLPIPFYSHHLGVVSLVVAEVDEFDHNPTP